MPKSNWEFVPNHEGIRKIEAEATEVMLDQAQIAIDRISQRVPELTLEQCSEELSVAFADVGFQLAPDTVSSIAENVHRGVPVTARAKGPLQVAFEIRDLDDHGSESDT